MYSTQCPDCYKGFSRRDAMLRHFKQKRIVNTTVSEGALTPPEFRAHMPPPPPPQGVISPAHSPPPPQDANMVFQHPFTMMVSGPTGNLKKSSLLFSNI